MKATISWYAFWPSVGTSLDFVSLETDDCIATSLTKKESIECMSLSTSSESSRKKEDFEFK